MTVEKVRKYCIKKRGVTEGFPFNDTTLVFKVMGKMFCLVGLTPPQTVNLKCDPEFAVELREKYDGITPGYHMNKTYWNTVDLTTNIREEEILKWIDLSYKLVADSLPKKVKAEFEKL